MLMKKYYFSCMLCAKDTSVAAVYLYVCMCVCVRLDVFVLLRAETAMLSVA